MIFLNNILRCLHFAMNMYYFKMNKVKARVTLKQSCTFSPGTAVIRQRFELFAARMQLSEEKTVPGLDFCSLDFCRIAV